MSNLIEVIQKSRVLQKDSAFFIYDVAIMQKNFELLKQFFKKIHSHVSISYSLKTNPNWYLLKKLIEKNQLGLDVSSEAELKYLKLVGADFSWVSVSGPGKTNACLQLAAKLGVAAIHVESLEELGVLTQIRDLKNISFRLKTDDIYAAKLGLNDHEIKIAFQMLKEKKISGLHAYLGRESFSIEKYRAIITKMLELKKTYQDQISSDFAFYIGPGLAHPNYDPLESVDLCGQVPVKVEMGRALMASTGYYFAQVLAVKETNNQRKVVIIDGGLQHLGSPLANLNQGLMNVNPFFIGGKHVLSKSSEHVEAALFGSLCLWHDNLHPKLQIPQDLGRGDWIGFEGVGAYGLTAGVPHFIGQALPQEYILEDNQLIDVTAKKFRSYHESFEPSK
jgi:diaminopimelate decarboxylase